MDGCLPLLVTLVLLRRFPTHCKSCCSCLPSFCTLDLLLRDYRPQAQQRTNLPVLSFQFGAFNFGARQFGAFHFGARQFGAFHFGARQFGAFHFGARQFGAFHFGARQFGAFHFGARQFGTFHFGARQFDAYQFGACHFDAIPVQRVSLWRYACLARFTLARFPFLCLC